MKRWTLLGFIVASLMMTPLEAAAQRQPGEDIRRGTPLPEEAHLFKVTTDVHAIAAQARMSLQYQQAALRGLSQAATDDYIPVAHYKAVFAYRLIRMAHENLGYRRSGQRFQDPVLAMAEKALHDSRFTVIKVDLTLDDGTTRDPARIAAAIEQLNTAISILEYALMLLP